MVIAGAACEVTRREGIEAVTARSVAGALDVSTMALYRHIESSGQLRTLALERSLARVAIVPREGSVSERLEGWARRTRLVVRRYPGVAEGCLAEWASLRQGCRIMEELLAVAAGHTADERKQAEIANAVFVYVMGRVANERGLAPGGSTARVLPAAESHARRFPRLVRARMEFTTGAAARNFTVGLDALIHGLLESTKS